MYTAFGCLKCVAIQAENGKQLEIPKAHCYGSHVGDRSLAYSNHTRPF